MIERWEHEQQGLRSTVKPYKAVLLRKKGRYGKERRKIMICER